MRTAYGTAIGLPAIQLAISEHCSGVMQSVIHYSNRQASYRATVQQALSARCAVCLGALPFVDVPLLATAKLMSKQNMTLPHTERDKQICCALFKHLTLAIFSAII